MKSDSLAILFQCWRERGAAAVHLCSGARIRLTFLGGRIAMADLGVIERWWWWW
jgi:hypothetical protein